MAALRSSPEAAETDNAIVRARIAADRALPSEPLVPNAQTIAAMREARRGGGPRFETVEALLADLNADE